MKTTRLALTVLTLAALIGYANAAIVSLDNSAGGLGALIDDYATPLPSSAFALSIPGSGTVNVTVVDFGPDGSINSTGTSLGINAATGSDDTDAFDASESEFLTLIFDKPISISELDFVNFDIGEDFEFGGVSIEYDDLANKSTDIFAFTTPLEIAANTNLTLKATTGTIGIEGFNITAVPEPSGFLLLSVVGVIGFARRWRANCESVLQRGV